MFQIPERNNYTITHIHTMLSNGVTNIDSVTDYHEYIDKAVELGMKAIAFTEHGNVFSWYFKKCYCEKKGLKYIHAIETYVTKDLNEKVRDNYHCCLYALNYDGVKELNKLSSKAFEDDHKYYTPRISFEELLNTSNNIAISTACLGGVLNSGDEELEGEFIKFLVKNKHRCFLEIQHHNTKSQYEYNKKLYGLHKQYGIPLIASTDTHALNQEHVEGRSILQKAKDIYFDDEDGWDLTMKSYDELVEAFAYHDFISKEDVFDAINNTNVLAKMVEDFTVDTSYKYPKMYEDSLEVFKTKIKEGVIRRGIHKLPNYEEYAERIREELKSYTHNGAIDFMLLMEDIVQWCMNHEIAIGYGRGSVNGSIIAYVLGITEMDSIKYNLNFQRFMNTERVSLADIDTDIPPSRVAEVREYVYNKAGLYCCDIITFNTVAMKGAIRDVCRALYKDSKPKEYIQMADYICKNVETDEERMRAEYLEVFKYVDIINGTIVSIGTHPCGLVCSPFPIDDWFGTCRTKTCPNPVSQIYMKEIDALNFVKLDLLSLDTIEIIDKACKLANIPMLTPDNLDVTDMNVWMSMREDTTGIFQWEGVAGDKYIKKLLSDETLKRFSKILSVPVEQLDLLTLLTIGNSAIRPAGASYREDLAQGVVKLSGSKAIDEFLSSTFGYLVFQCQIIQFLHEYCGFTMGQADIVRRGFAKKTGTDQYIPIIKNGGYMNDKKTHYIKGFIQTMKEKYDMKEEEAEESIVAFLQVIEDASSYLFSLNHSQPYSLEGYACGWLRYYYPLEFLTTELNTNQDKQEKTDALMNYINKVGIQLKNPQFRYSKGEYFFDKESNSIYKGIGSIKFFNNNVGEQLYSLRDNQYTRFEDLLKDIYEQTDCNSKHISILIKIGFFEEFGNINKLLRTYEIFDELYNKKQITFKKAQEVYNVTEEVLSQFGNNISEKTGKAGTTYKELDWLGFVKYLVDRETFEEPTIATKIGYQLECLGFSNITDSTLPKSICYVSNLETNSYGTIFATLYCINNGKNVVIRVDKRFYNAQEEPLEKGDVISISVKKEPCKAKNPNPTGKHDIWIETGEYRTVLKSWSYIV